LKENVIYIENGKYSDIQDSLKKWIESYAEKLPNNFKFKLYKVDEKNTVIELSADIENVLFYFLVNYLTYPEGLIQKVTVKGFTRIEDNKRFSSTILNEPVQIFIPKDDSEFDIVFGTMKSGATFKINFGGKITKVNSDIEYNIPDYDYKNVTSQTLGIDKELILEKQKKSEIKKFNQRFILIATIYFVGTVIAGYFYTKTDQFLIVVKISSFSLIVWVMFEHSLLRKVSVYLKMLAVAIFLALWGHFLSVENTNDVWLKATRLSLIFLVLQKILRFIYILIYKREPEFDNTGKLMVDRVYFFILFFGSLFTSMSL
jgi:hypothetical protein